MEETQTHTARLSPRGKRGWLLAALLLAHAVYAFIFIARTSFVVDGQRYFCLVDDAMISMRYARNFAAGAGWVWNVGGERVEGYTNPLWGLIMAAIHLMPLSPAKTSLAVQLLGEAILLVNLMICYYVTRRVLPHPAALGTVACVAFYYPLNNWTLQGMEVGALTLCLTVAAFLLLREERYRVRVFIPTCFAMALRPDGIVPHGVVTLAAALRWREQRGRAALAGILTAVAVFGGWTLFRRAYYGDWLPNTYYLKMTGFPTLLRISRGAFHAAVFWTQWSWPLLAVLGLLLLARRGVTAEAFRLLRRTYGQSLAVLLAFVVAQTAYSIYVGGDAWERVTGANRFIAPAMPLAFIIVAVLIFHLCSGQAAALGSGRWGWLLLVLFVVNANAYYGRTSLAQTLLVEPPPYCDDNIRNVRLARWLDTVTLPRARIAIDYAGTAPYFLDREMIDLLGKCDRRIAHMPARRGVLGLPAWREFYPGHLKWDYAYSIGELQPDVVCAMWRRSRGDADRYLERDYVATEFAGVSVYLRRNSPAIAWQRIGTAQLPTPPGR
jgi:arabinofuranosyltransferase